MRSMAAATKSLNVRIDAEDARKIEALRGEGVEISDLVRKAIREEYKRRHPRPRTPADVEAMLRRLYEKYPPSPDEPPRTYDVHNAQEARAAIIAHLNRKKRS